jgi:hypothetical protein
VYAPELPEYVLETILKFGSIVVVHIWRDEDAGLKLE